MREDGFGDPDLLDLIFGEISILLPILDPFADDIVGEIHLRFVHGSILPHGHNGVKEIFLLDLVYEV